jgi:hypothetical protein
LKNTELNLTRQNTDTPPKNHFAKQASQMCNLYLIMNQFLCFQQFSWKKLKFYSNCLIILALGLGLSQNLSAQCSNISPNGTCAGVVPTLPVNLTFNGSQGGILGANSVGTGFTMVQAPTGTRLSADAPVFSTTYPGYEPSKLNVNGGNLILSTNKGIANVNFNNQLNTLGIGFQPANQEILLETALINFTTGSSNDGQQAGLWYGTDNNNFIKLNLINNNRIEFRRETAGASTTATDLIQSTALSGVNTSTVKLKLRINHKLATPKAKAYYQIGNNAEVYFGEFTFNYGSGVSLSGSINNVFFGGIYGSYRNGSASFDANFDYFNASVVPGVLAFNPLTQNLSLNSGSSQNFNANLTVNDETTPTVSLSANSNGNVPTWLKLNGNLLDGSVTHNLSTSQITFTADATGLSAGDYSATITASLNGYSNATLTVQLNVPPQNLTFNPTVLNFTVAQGGTVAGQNANLGGVANMPVNLSVPNGGNWVSLPNNPQTGDLLFNINAGGLIPGNYKTFVTASANGFTNSTLEVNLTVTPVMPVVSTWDFKINFQGAATPPSGYIRDAGDAYGSRGSGRTFGWISAATSEPFNNTAQARVRSATTYASTPLELRSFNHMQMVGVEANWEMALANGWYYIKVSVGDIQSFSSVHIVNVEGKQAVKYDQATANVGGFREGEIIVQVLDGKLTLDAYGGNNTKVNYVWIERLLPANDNIAPTVTFQYDGVLQSPGVYRNPLIVKVLANDQEGSGITSLEYSLNGGAYQPYLGNLLFEAPGNYTLSVKAIDGNNNQTITPHYAFQVVNATLSNAKLVVENTYKFPDNNNYAFSFVQYSLDNRELKGPNYDFPNNTNYNHDANVIRLYNRGISPLVINDLILSDNVNFRIDRVNATSIGTGNGRTPLANLMPLVVPQNSFIELTVIFTARLYPDRVKIFHEKLSLVSNDDTAPVKVLNLHGLYQFEYEGDNEPNAQEMIEGAGLSSKTGFVLSNNNHTTPMEDEIFSPYFVRVDASKPVTVRQMAAYHGCCNNTESISWQPKAGGDNWIMTHHPKDGQTLLPRKNNGDLCEGAFNPTVPFSFRISGDNTDPVRNAFKGTHPQGFSYPQLRGARVWKARDWNGNIIPNAYIIAHDYLGGGANLDYNDNMYYVENMRPEVGSDFNSELVTGNGVNGSPDQTQSALEYNPTAIQTVTNKTLSLRSLGQTFVGGADDPDIIISNVEIIGANLNEFSVAMPTDPILSPGEMISFNVSFRPQTAGIKNAVLLIHYNNDLSPMRIPLYGIATSSCFNLALFKRIKSAAAINFTVNGRTWDADQSYRGGNTIAMNTTDNTSEIAATDDDALYRAYLSTTANNIPLNYNIPLTNGRYLVRLHFAENLVTTPGARVNGIYFENNLALANYDIFGNVGFKTAQVKDFEVSVVDGVMNIQLLPVNNRPAIAALEIYSISSTSPITLTASQINGANCGTTSGSITLTANNVPNGVNMLYKIGKFGTYQTSNVFNNLAAGSYTIYAKEDLPNGCEIDKSFIINELNNNITFDITTTPVSCEATSDGTATVSNISGGAAPYTIRWNTFPVQTLATATGLPAGNFTQVTVTDATGCSKTQTVVITNTLTCPIRINAAGAAFTASGNRKFIADQYFTGGQASTITRPIANTEDDVLYQSERWSNVNLPYNIPVVNGNYQITLHFAEIYFNNPNQRKFHVDIEGTRVLTDFDVIAVTGGRDIAVTRTFNVNVNDGTLNLVFAKGSVDNPKVSAIEVVYLGSSGNNPPTLATPIPDQVASKGAFFNMTVSEYTFVDSDPNTTLTYSATLANGNALPTWLIFNTQTRTFTGTPSVADIGQLSVKVTVTDNGGASVSDEFNLLINDGTGGTIGGTVSFLRSRVKNLQIGNPTSLQFGPDGKLYVSQVNGLIKIFTIQRTAANDYTVTATENIDLVQRIPNYNDDGNLNAGLFGRQVLGIMVTGTASNPVVYVSSNDPRTGGGNGDLNLDTNSGTISRLTKNGQGQWEKVDIIRGLPKSEHNHATNGLAIDKNTNKLYIAQGGHANKGAPSHELAWLPEYAYSAAILEVDMATIEAMPIQGTGNNRYIYDLPTLAPKQGATGPFGGDNGFNQAVLVQGGPVQVYSPGHRNAYDIVITQAGNMYSWDNSSNAGWGVPPIYRTSDNLATNIAERDFDNNVNGLQSSHYKIVDNFTYYDPLHKVTKGYYAGNPNPTRANPSINRFNGLSPIPNGFDFGFPHGTNQANGLENNFLHSGRDGVVKQNSSLVGVMGSTNGITEFRGSNFSNQMKGNLLAASFNGNLYRVILNQNGTALDNTVPHNGSGINGLIQLATGFGTWNALDVTSQGDAEIFPGSIWVAEYGQNAITVLEPVDFNQCNYSSPTSNLTADFDSDGYSNGDEISNNTDPCSPASVPEDWDNDKVSDLSDTDDDNDGILDLNDAFALDKDNGTKTSLPIIYEWEAASPPAGYILNTGFTGLMINGTANYKNLYNRDNMTVIGTAGFFTVDQTTAKTSLGTTNNQEYGFQFGYNAVNYPGKYQIHTAIIQPFGNMSLGDLTDQTYGVFLGKGDQKNYLKLVADANSGSTGLRVVYENNDVIIENTLHNVDILGEETVHMYLIINPFTNEVQPAYSIDAGAVIELGTPIAVPAAWLQNVLATGIMSTSGTGVPITVTWGFFRVEPVPSTSEANFVVNSGNTLESTTTQDNSFKITNNSPDGQKITKVVIDLTTTVLPDMVFDPNNVIKDMVSAKPFTVNAGGTETGFTTSLVNNPFNGSNANGFTRLEINFTDFDLGETFEFSIDTDPSTIKTTNSPNATGNVSGLELIGATVSLSFSDFSGYSAQLYRTNGELGASQNGFKQTAILAPNIQCTTLSPLPNETTSSFQTIKINGEPGTNVRLLVLEGGLFLNNLASGTGFDVDAYEANKLLKIADEEVVTIPYQGTVDVPITLSLTTDPNWTSGINHIVAVTESADGRTSRLSNVLKIRLKTGPPVATFRINAAGVAYNTLEGAAFVADADVAANRTGTSNAYTAVQEIADTEDDVLYQSERWGNTFAYNLPVNNGKYQVILHFAEIYFGIAGRAGVGARVFNVAIENQPKLSNYDIIAQAGGTLKAIQESFLLEVTDGVLNINFTSVNDNAKISAIEVIPVFGNTAPYLVNALPDRTVQVDPGLTNPFNFTVPTNTFGDLENDPFVYSATLENGEPLPGWINFDPNTRTFTGNGSQYQVNPNFIMVRVTAADAGELTASDVFKVTVFDPSAPIARRINAAGGAYTTVNGDEFVADTYVTGGSTFTNTALQIADTDDDVLYRSERWGPSTYNIPVVNGNYKVILHFAEIYFTQAGQRRFNVNIDGQHTLTNFDVVAQAGGANKAIKREFNILVLDGFANIAFTNGSNDNAKISAIEVVPNPNAPNNAPRIVNAIPNQQVLMNSPSKVFDLGTVFTDWEDGTNLIYTVTNNTNTNVVTTQVIDKNLTLGFVTDAVGTAQITIRATDKNSGLPAFVEQTFTVIVSDYLVLHRVNAGGASVAAADGSTPAWTADTAATPYSGVNSSASNNVSGTGDAITLSSSLPNPLTTPTSLFQSNRWMGNGANMLWDFAAPTGKKIEVRLYFAETAFNAANTRKFDIVIDGVTKIANFDIFAEAGHDVGIMRSFIIISDGNVDIDLMKKIENPMISGIEILDISGRNTAPIVLNPLSDISVTKNSLPSNINLSSVFSDLENDNLTYTVSSNTNTGLLNPILISNSLQLNYILGQIGTGTIKIRATDPKGLFAEDEFNVNVNEPQLILYRVNGGGSQVTMTNGTPNWSVDSAAQPSPYLSNTGASVGGNGGRTITVLPTVPVGTPSSIFASERWIGTGNLNWDFPVPAGQKVEVRLYFAEIWNGITANGQRVFHVDVDGTRRIANYDVFAETGAIDRGTMKSYQLTSDGNIDIDLVRVTQNPKINAIEIILIPPTIQVSQNTKGLVAGSSTQQVLRLEIENADNQTLSGLAFNTNGTTNPMDLKNAKVFYTGVSANFSSTVQFNSNMVASPNGAFVMTGNQTLAVGKNYFWLTFDIDDNAFENNLVDAEFAFATIAGNNATPVVASPAGNRKVVQLDCQAGLALNYNASNSLASVNTGITIAPQFTMEAWVFPRQNTQNTWLMGETNGARVIQNGSQFEFSIHNGTNISGLATAGVRLNTWNHVAAVYDGMQLQLYVNGRLGTVANLVGNNADQNGAFAIGASGLGQMTNDMLIDEVRVWSVARTADQLRQMMRLTNIGKEIGLENYWQMNQVSSFVEDKIGNTQLMVSNLATAQATQSLGCGAPMGLTQVKASANKGGNNGGTQPLSGGNTYVFTGASSTLEVSFVGTNYPASNEVVVSELNGSPSNAPVGSPTTGVYWVVENYGTATEFDPMGLKAIVGSGEIGSNNPNAFSLYKRNSGAMNSWNQLFHNLLGAPFIEVTPDMANNSIEFAGQAGNTNLTSFGESPSFESSDFFLSNATSPLPVTLVAFNGKRLNDTQAELTWRTAQEINNKGFEIQKRAPSQQFETVAFVDGLGTSNSGKNYRWVDTQAKDGAYYRLKQIDFDGTVNYSREVFVAGSEIDELLVYPNPIINSVDFRSSAALQKQTNLRMEIINQKGEMMMQAKGNLEELKNSINQRISQFSAGVYVMRVHTEGKIYTIKLIKN